MTPYQIDSKFKNAGQIPSHPSTVLIVFGKDFVLSFQESLGDVFDTVRERIRKGKGRIRKSGPDYLAYALMDALIDGAFPNFLDLPQQPIPKGDALSISIAAASIIAKVTRDRLMDTYHIYYPCFGFSRHKGYPTQDHRQAIRAFGCSPIHRRTFRWVREHLPAAERGCAC